MHYNSQWVTLALLWSGTVLLFSFRRLKPAAPVMADPLMIFINNLSGRHFIFPQQMGPDLRWVQAKRILASFSGCCSYTLSLWMSQVWKWICRGSEELINSSTDWGWGKTLFISGVLHLFYELIYIYIHIYLCTYLPWRSACFSDFIRQIAPLHCALWLFCSKRIK